MSQSHLPPTRGARPRRFNAHLDGLRGEFDLMAQEIESWRKKGTSTRQKVCIPSYYHGNTVLLSCYYGSRGTSEGTRGDAPQARFVSDVEREIRALLKLSPRLG
jgi:hypothetical protein